MNAPAPKPRITIHGLTRDEYDAYYAACDDLERSVGAQTRLLIREFLKTTPYGADGENA